MRETLEEIKRSGKIYVAFTSDDLKNINHDLALEFARYLNVELIEVEIEWDEAFMKDGVRPPDLKTDPDLSYTPDALKKADIICSTFTIIEWRKKLFGFAQNPRICRIADDQSKMKRVPSGFDELSGKQIAFMGSTTIETHLKEINASIGEWDPALFQQKAAAETKQLLQNKDVYGIILDADEALAFNASSEQKYKIAFPISDITRMAWAVEKNNPLIQEVENFFETIASNEVLDEIFYRRFGITYSAYLDRLSKNLKLDRYQRDLDEILESKKLVVALRDRNFIYRGRWSETVHACPCRGICRLPGCYPRICGYSLF